MADGAAKTTRACRCRTIAGDPHPQARRSRRAARPRPPISRRCATGDGVRRRPGRHRQDLSGGRPGASPCCRRGTVDRIVLSRPAVEAGERLGFLPGDMKEKVDPYLRPLYDALHDMLPAEQVERRHRQRRDRDRAARLHARPHAGPCFVILDEAQNTTPMQMKMFLTRMGEGTRMVVTGDPTQIDLPSGSSSGPARGARHPGRVQGIGVVRFDERDVVRHPLVARSSGLWAAPTRAAESGETSRSSGRRGEDR